MAFRRLNPPALYNRSWCRINDVITLGGVMWHGESPVMDDSREKNSIWKEREKYERVTDEHNERSSISLLYLLDVWNTHKHTHLSVRREGTQREKRLISAQSFNQVVCMSTMLWISCRLIFTVVFLAGEPFCCSRTKSQWTLWIFFISSSELQQSHEPWDNSAPISSGRVSALRNLMKTDEAAEESCRCPPRL